MNKCHENIKCTSLAAWLKIMLADLDLSYVAFLGRCSECFRAYPYTTAARCWLHRLKSGLEKGGWDFTLHYDVDLVVHVCLVKTSD